WIFEGNTEHINHWALDDMLLEAEPALKTDPSQYEFEPQLINNNSDPKTFVLQNTGGGVLSLSPSDIFLDGDDKDQFLLDNLSEDVDLQHGETAEVSVIFQPQSTGEKTTTLVTPGQNAIIQGESYDPVITSFPWKEDFTAITSGEIPLGWSRNAVNWGVFNASNAGGQAPEMVFWWQPETQGKFTLFSPPILPGSNDSLILSFRHRVNDFASPGNYTLKVTVKSGDEETTLHKWEDPSDIDPEKITTLLNKQNHWVNNDTIHLSWIFEGITDNITQWDIDDIELRTLPEEPILNTEPDSYGFEAQTVGSVSDPALFILKNTGGANLILQPTDIFISGEFEDAFILENIQNTVELDPYEETTIEVSFAPVQTGENVATLHVSDEEIPLSGFGSHNNDIFVYSDFTVSEEGMDYTNLEGFREIPEWASESLAAEDLQGQGEHGGAVLQLNYNLNLTDDFTSYWMWAYPFIDVSQYTHLVFVIRAAENTSGLKIQLFDDSGIQGTNGAGYFYVDATEQWQWISIPVSEFSTMDWANDLPDMSKIQRVDLVFEKDLTSPTSGSVFLDLVGFSQGDTNIEEFLFSEPFKMYPNPASKKVTIISAPNVNISISDISGKELLAKKTDSELTHLDISSLNKGVYFVTLSDGQNRNVKKLILQ
ncbi:MAG: choice-of-anchor D domain-containing protein, partial [Bacteroidota bacterium]